MTSSTMDDTTLPIAAPMALVKMGSRYSTPSFEGWKRERYSSRASAVPLRCFGEVVGHFMST